LRRHECRPVHFMRMAAISMGGYDHAVDTGRA
jgi:hypothetical protein